ncbi:uncharacterized protein LOC133736653 isoform X1 [Rosa rugosa]|uniref:uncharacterized protein LOC133736653 isoform X1 n=1 Tax=Rosa rugosa TaxID=74645 RepID=UPI002B40D484|nr:uncharacterized protein LOC133736653 isoform X1 [Rosa rugosa]XP_062020216.1 uncharacterized protein LOC133736653 isoform X1 [Rosa rugosa]
MSDCVVRSYPESEGTNEQTCDSVWMAHWMCTSCNSETKACGHVSIHYEDARKQNDGVQKHPLFRGFGEVAEPKRLRKNNEGVTLTESSKKLRKERLEGQSFPMFNVPPKTSLAKQNQQDSTVNRRLLSESNSSAMLGWAPADARPLEAIPPLKEQQVKYHNFLEDSSPAVSKSFQDGPVSLDSKLALHQFKCGSTSMPFFICRDKEVNQSNSLLAPQHVANTNNYSSSTFLIHEKNINSKLASRKSGGSFSRQNDVMLLQRDPSTSRKHVQEMQSKSGVGLFPSQSSSSEVTRHEKPYLGFYSAPILQHADRNTETMRICAAVDVEKESSRGYPKCSQTTTFPRKTGFNSSEGGHMFGETTISTKLKGKAFCELLVSPEHTLPVQTGLRLLPYRSSIDSEEEDVRDVKRPANSLDNESSSETDTMDMDAFQFQDNLPLGVASSPTNEHTEGGQKSPTSKSAFTSAREEVRGRPPFTKLPDMNQELPVLAALSSLVDERETSPSRTQSLDVEHLLSHAEPTNSKSSASPDGPQGIEPSCRWVKRLKLSASHFAYGTKSTKMGEASSHEKVNALYKKNMKCSATNSQPAMGRFHSREQMSLDETPMLLRNGELSSSDSARTSQNISLSHPWIRRWSHKVVAPHKNSESAAVSRPQSSKATLDQFQKKRFPSIAAMALMGKAMNGCNPCEFAKKGSFVVWNAKGF